MKLRDLIYISLCSVILAICSWITIPGIIPFNLGLFGVFLVTLILGGKRGTIAVAIYILLGIAGIPVFAGFRGGIGVLLGNTGGYIIGYLFISLIMWGTEHFFLPKDMVPRRIFIPRIASMLLGLCSCYTCGTFWFLQVYSRNTEHIGFMGVLALCVFPYVFTDLLKIGLALWVSRKLKKYISIQTQR